MTDATAEMEAEAYALERAAGYLLRKAHQRATEHFNAVMAGHGVTPTQFAALAKLDDEGEVSQNRLGRLTAMDPATISSVVGRLAARGWVAQRPAESDARLVLLALTPEGEAATRAMKADASEVTRRILAPLSGAQVRALIAALERIG